MKKMFLFCALFVTFTLTLANISLAGGGNFITEKIGIDSGRDLLMVVNIPATTDDPRLASTSSTNSYQSNCIGPDGNQFLQQYTTTKYTWEIYVPEMNFWNMNNLHVSVKWVDEDTQQPSKGYSDYSVQKDPGSHAISLTIAYQDCNNGYPDWGQNYYDQDKQAWICPVIIEGDCHTEFNIAGDALISLETYRKITNPNPHRR